MTLDPPKPSHPISRFLRVLFSVTVCTIAALMIASMLWTDFEGHYTHRAAMPIFVITLGATLVGIFILIFTLVFYWMDRRAWKKGKFSPKTTRILMVALGIGLLSGFVSDALGALFLFPTLYWLMTGRVAGRQGWSIRHFSAPVGTNRYTLWQPLPCLPRS